MTRNVSVKELRVEEAKQARDVLVAALRRADLQLLTLRLDPQTTAEEALSPLIDLGRCSPRMARALAAVITKGARDTGEAVR